MFGCFFVHLTNVSATIGLWFILTSIFVWLPPPHLLMQISLDNARLIQIGARVQVYVLHLSLALESSQ